MMYSGGHDATIVAVGSGKVEAGAVADRIYERGCAKGLADCNKLKVVWTSPPIPNDPLLYRRNLSEDMKKRIREAFFSVKNLAFGEMGTVARFDPATDKDYDPIRDIASALKLDLQQDEVGAMAGWRRRSGDAAAARTLAARKRWRLHHIALAAGLVAFLAWCADGVNLRPREVAGALPVIGEYFARMAPPKWEFSEVLWKPAAETLYIALWGNVIALLIGLAARRAGGGERHALARGCATARRRCSTCCAASRS